MKYEQMYDGSNWVQESGKHFTQVCCDCGSSHNIKVSVLNEEEVEVTLFKNIAMTKQARKDGCNGVLVSPETGEFLLKTSKLLTKGKFKKARKLARQYVKQQNKFAKIVKSGEHLS